MNIAQPDSRHSTGILYQWVNWMGKEKKSFTIYLHFSPKALKERNSVGGNISRWIASVNKAWGLWPLKDLCTCRWEIAWYLTWPILAEIKNFLIIFPNSSARESWSYAAYFKDKPLKETKQTLDKLVEWQSPLLKWTFIINVEQVHFYSMLGRMKGGIKWSHLLLTVEVQRQFACEMLRVFDKFCVLLLALCHTSQW